MDAMQAMRQMRGVLLAGVVALGAPTAAMAQGVALRGQDGPPLQQGTPGTLAPNAPAGCQCTTRPVDPPWVPPVGPPPGTPPGTPGGPPGSNPPGAPNAPRPSRTGWAAIGAAGLALVAGVPLGSALQPAMPFRPVVAEMSEQPVIVAELPASVPLPVEAAGILAPNTASHLPLLLAVGIAAIAAGIALLRDRKRRRRRRRVVVS